MKNLLPFSAKFLVLSASLAFAWSVHAKSTSTVATPKETFAPSLDFASSNETGQVKLIAKVNKYGFVVDVDVSSSTNSALNQPSIDALHRWTFHPATKGGKNVASKVRQVFTFEIGAIAIGDVAAKSRLEAPKVLRQISPRLSKRYSNITGQVNFLVNLDDQGELTQITLKNATHEELAAAAESALRKWKFQPASKRGEPIASTVVVPFIFYASDASRERTIRESRSLDLVDVQPKLTKRHEPTLPLSMEKETGDAWLHLYIDEHGYVAQADPLKSSNPSLAKYAQEAALQWKFDPAIKDGQPVASKTAVPFRFTGGLLLSEAPVDKNPELRHSPKPKVPSELADASGFVRVLLRLDEKGNVVGASARGSSREDLEALALEAVQSWKFNPAVREGLPVSSSVIVPFEFTGKKG